MQMADSLAACDSRLTRGRFLMGSFRILSSSPQSNAGTEARGNRVASSALFGFAIESISIPHATV
jgi:hypothetical protein